MQADLKKRFLGFVRSEALFTPPDPVLLAVSGGIDSMVMTDLFKSCELRFGIAHVNFQLRGSESDEDENFVKQTAAALAVPFFSTRFNTREIAKERKVSIQMAARKLRYEWLEKIRIKNAFHRIATAHHKDDSIETVLLNIFRGTGIRGLQGIPSMNEKTVRPLLCFSKAELIKHAEEKAIAWREDSSNLLIDYERNKIRLEVIPAIEKSFPAFRDSISDNIANWKDAASLFELSLLRLKNKVTIQNGEEVLISIPALLQAIAARTILFETLKEFGFRPEQAESIFYSLKGESGKLFFSATHRLIKDRKHLIVSPLSAVPVSETIINRSDKLVQAGSLTLSITEIDASGFAIPPDARFSCLDIKELEFPLVLRKWKKGDYFFPLGMKMKKKKISDYLIDRKVPLHEKENTWVIESGNRIACIIGERIDHRFRIQPGTTGLFVIERK